MEPIKGDVQVTVLGDVWVYTGAYWASLEGGTFIPNGFTLIETDKNNIKFYRETEKDVDVARGALLTPVQKTFLLTFFGYKRYKFDVEGIEGVVWARNRYEVDSLLQGLTNFNVEESKIEEVTLNDIVLVKYENMKEFEHVLS